jgi:aldehyde:ferredoxin oxidoreductase
MAQHGYAGEILKVDLSKRKISKLETSDYADRFLGGRGIAAKIFWDENCLEAGAFDAQNPLIFITGPLAGFTRFSGCRWQICGKSPQMQPEYFSYANLGGSWGSWLKYSGYDGLVVTGKADSPVYILIDGDKIEIKDALHLKGQTAVETQSILQADHGSGTKVLATGPAGENLITFATVLAAENASGSSGFGAVMGSKNLKAIVVRADEKKRPAAADPDRLKALADEVYRLRTRNFEDYQHILPLKIRFTACYGCIIGCTRGSYEAEDGRQYKVLCQASGVYMWQAMKYDSEHGPEVNRLAGRLCDGYGFDTAVISPMIAWIDRCHEAGILSDEETGLPLSKIGSAEFIETLTRKLAFREGFGDILAQGTLKAAEYVGKGSEKLLEPLLASRANETRDHDPRLSLANALLLAMEPRRPIQLVHSAAFLLTRWMNWREGWKDALLSTEIFLDIAQRYLGSKEGADYSTYDGKALASRNIQDYGYVKESLILCDLVWPIHPVNPPDRSIGPLTLESRILSALTGRDFDEGALKQTGERIFNLQRAILMRQGWGGRKGDNLLGYYFHDKQWSVFYSPEGIVPGKDGEPASRKGAVIEKIEFEKLKDEYYKLRGWDVESGRQTRAKLEELQLGDIADNMDKKILQDLTKEDVIS